MSTTTTLSLSDTLPSAIPKLEAEGKNWVIFYVCFMNAIQAKGFWGHFNGTTPKPTLSSEPTDEELKEKNQWDKDKCSAKTLLTQKLPNSTVMKIHSKKTVMEQWEAVVKEYTQKGVYMKMELKAKFLMLRCLDKGNVKDFLRGLRLKEELVQVGVMISNKDLSTIISSLPDLLSNFTSLQIAWMMQQSLNLIDTNALMSMLLQEVARQNLRSLRHKVGSIKRKEDEKSEVLVVDQSLGKREQDLSFIDCWNCGEKGHFRSKCPKPRKFKTESKKLAEANSNPKADSVPRTTSAVKEISNEEGAWVVYEIMDEVISNKDWFEEAVSNNDEMPQLIKLSTRCYS